MSLFTLEQRDALREGLLALEPESVDLYISDFPYESLERHRVHPDGTPRGRVPRLTDWFPVIKNESLGELMKLIYRAMKKNTHTYVYTDAETLFDLKPAGEAAGFKFWKPLVWDKEQIGMGYHYRSRCEFIAFFEKGKRNLFDLGVPDILEAKSVRGANKLYPTEKPVAIAEVLVLQSSIEGDLVLDSFMGSGSTGVAAVKHGRRFHGMDVQAKSLQVARERLDALIQQQEVA